MIERKFINDARRRLIASDYIKKELEKAGIIDVDIQRTTLATRITLVAERPGIVIGRKGKNIQDLGDAIAKELGTENPQIEVIDVERASLEPAIISKWIARLLERNYKPKRVLQRGVSRVMDAGAMGVEISLKGKLMGKGAKARKESVLRGYLKKAGDSTKKVRYAHARAYLKQGIVGVSVRIVPPEVVFPDKIDIKKLLEERKMRAAAETEADEIKRVKEKAEDTKKEEKKQTVKKTAKKKAVKKKAVKKPAKKTAKKAVKKKEEKKEEVKKPKKTEEKPKEEKK